MVTDRGATQVRVAGDEEGAGVARLELQLPHTTQSVRRARRTIAAFLEPSEVPGAVVEDVVVEPQCSGKIVWFELSRGA